MVAFCIFRANFPKSIPVHNFVQNRNPGECELDSEIDSDSFHPARRGKVTPPEGRSSQRYTTPADLIPAGFFCGDRSGAFSTPGGIRASRQIDRNSAPGKSDTQIPPELPVSAKQ